MKAGVILVDKFTKMLSEKYGGHHKNAKRVNCICPKCNDRGYVLRTDERGIEIATKCECYAVRQAERIMRMSGISEEFAGKSFDNFITKGNEQLISAKAKAVGYVDNFSQTERKRYNSILFSGQVGAGKTHLGMAISTELMNRGISVVYMAYRNVVTRIKQKVTNEDLYSKELAVYMTARVLFIDDLLKGKLSDSDINILYEIANYRYMNNLPIIISTEKTPNELMIFDEAIGSRLIEMCRGNIVVLWGKELNYRLS